MTNQITKEYCVEQEIAQRVELSALLRRAINEPENMIEMTSLIEQSSERNKQLDVICDIFEEDEDFVSSHLKLVDRFAESVGEATTLTLKLYYRLDKKNPLHEKLYNIVDTWGETDPIF